MKSKRTPEEQRQDIIHQVNVLIVKARDGEYGKPGHQQLYRKFHSYITRLAMQAEGVSSDGSRHIIKSEGGKDAGCTYPL